ncbi:sugar diacid recognition domain-containing protein [Peribacillus frigoritolerans]
MLAKLAQEIADITSEVIGHDVLITDKDGIVLGSSDKSRIGTLHQASLGAIFRRKEMTHNEVVSSTLKGVKPGITTPIELSGEYVGTLGITGYPMKYRSLGCWLRNMPRFYCERKSSINLPCSVNGLYRVSFRKSPF